MPFWPRDPATWTRFRDHLVFCEARPLGLSASLFDGEPYPYYGRCAPEWYVHVEPPPAPEVGEAAADRDLLQLRTLALEVQRADPRWNVEFVVLDDYTSFLFLIDGYGRHCSVWAGEGLAIDLNTSELHSGEEEQYELESLHLAVRLLTRYGSGVPTPEFRLWRTDLDD